ncbi:MAG: GNAT family acetyltransferase [Streptococcaceae bacterium]|jgi:hypothetical protein|nr:GNAT family acetyltransferase [Streptococcaceae bacterium]
MELIRISLNELLNNNEMEDVKDILHSFSSNSEDIQNFLHNRAIQFERTGIARTYLVIYSSDDEEFLAGYFSIANKALNVTQKNFEKLSNTQRKLLLGQGYRDNTSKNYVSSSVLLGQIGKNFSSENTLVSGTDILGVAKDTIKEIYKILGGKILWLECEDTKELRNFYEKNGFSLLNGFQNDKDFLVYVKKMSHL